MGHRIGDIRVSSGDQQPARQLDQVAVDRVFIDYASGKDLERPQLAQLLAFVRPGDTVVVHSLDRLARNLEDLRQLVSRWTHQGVRVEFLHEQLTFTGEGSPMAQLMRSVMGAFAEFERALLRERQREGIALAKQRGVYRGRKRALTTEAIFHCAFGNLWSLGVVILCTNAIRNDSWAISEEVFNLSHNAAWNAVICV